MVITPLAAPVSMTLVSAPEVRDEFTAKFSGATGGEMMAAANTAASAPLTGAND